MENEIFFHDEIPWHSRSLDSTRKNDDIVRFGLGAFNARAS